MKGNPEDSLADAFSKRKPLKGLVPEGVSQVRAGGLLPLLREDVATVLQRDPAARSRLEVVLGYPGLHAIWAHRVSRRFWLKGARISARLLSQAARWATGVEIHPGAVLGRRLFIDHGMGVVIGETATLGDDVTIYHGVTLGGTSLSKGKRHPDIGDRVTIGAGAKILGNIAVGDDSRIGANAVVVKSVPANSVVVGIPGRAVLRARLHGSGDAPDLDHVALPDVVGRTMLELLTRVSALENDFRRSVQRVPSNKERSLGPSLDATEPKRPETGREGPEPSADLWHGGDFCI